MTSIPCSGCFDPKIAWISLEYMTCTALYERCLWHGALITARCSKEPVRRHVGLMKSSSVQERIVR